MNRVYILFVLLGFTIVAACHTAEPGLPLHTPAGLAWIDRDGSVEPIEIPPRNYIYVQLSPDGTRVALNARDESSDIWIFNLESKSLRRLTLDAEPNIGPLWAPDGRLAYTRIINGTQEIVLQDADGSAPAETISIVSDNNKYPTSFAADGSTLIFHTSTFGYDMWSLSLASGRNTEHQLLTSQYRETNGVLSPDGRWLAYELDATGQLEVYISPYPAMGSTRVQVSFDGGSRPHWNSDGSELFYIDQYESGQSGAMMAADFDADSGSVNGSPTLLFAGNFHSPVQGQGRQLYDVAADGQSFLMITRIAPSN